jgi:hypothetical protein
MTGCGFYDNAKLSLAMILSGYWTCRGEVVDIGLRSLRWLVEQQKAERGHFAPIGSNGFWIAAPSAPILINNHWKHTPGSPLAWKRTR